MVFTHEERIQRRKQTLSRMYGIPIEEIRSVTPFHFHEREKAVLMDDEIRVRVEDYLCVIEAKNKAEQHLTFSYIHKKGRRVQTILADLIKCSCLFTDAMVVKNDRPFMRIWDNSTTSDTEDPEKFSDIE